MLIIEVALSVGRIYTSDAVIWRHAGGRDRHVRRHAGWDEEAVLVDEMIIATIVEHHEEPLNDTS